MLITVEYIINRNINGHSEIHADNADAIKTSIRKIVNLVESYLRRGLEEDEYTQIVYPYEWFKSYELESGHEAYIKYTPVNEDISELPSGVSISDDGERFLSISKPNKIKYTGGYTEETLPEDLKSVIADLVIYDIVKASQGRQGIDNRLVSTGDITATISSEDKEYVSRMLKMISHYKRIVI